MAFVHGKSSFIMLNGYDLTGYLNKIDTPATADTAETTCFQSDNKTFLPGLKDGTLSAEGLYEASANAVDEILNSVFAGANSGNNIMWFPSGNTLGNIGYAMNMIQTAYNVTGTKDDAARINMAGQSSVGRERVKLLQAHASVAATGDGTQDDNDAATTEGGAAYIHASAVTGSLDVIIEGSATGAFSGEETTIATFTQLTGRGHERIAISGTIPQYVRTSYTIVTGPAVFAVALCRN
jgi:hypothetical protein